MAKITENMTVMEVMQIAPEAAEVFTAFGMHCIHCAIAHGETVAQAAQVHGIDLNEMLDKLNKVAEENA